MFYAGREQSLPCRFFSFAGFLPFAEAFKTGKGMENKIITYLAKLVFNGHGFFPAFSVGAFLAQAMSKP